MAWTETDLDTLDKAIATGARKVRYADGRETEFRSLADMQTTRSMIATALGIVAAPANPRTLTIEHRR